MQVRITISNNNIKLSVIVSKHCVDLLCMLYKMYIVSANGWGIYCMYNVQFCTHSCLNLTYLETDFPHDLLRNYMRNWISKEQSTGLVHKWRYGGINGLET
jgi:hypothetical protein